MGTCRALERPDEQVVTNGSLLPEQKYEDRLTTETGIVCEWRRGAPSEFFLIGCKELTPGLDLEVPMDK